MSMDSVRILIEQVAYVGGASKTITRHEVEAHGLVTDQASEYFADVQKACDAFQVKAKEHGPVTATRTISKRRTT